MALDLLRGNDGSTATDFLRVDGDPDPHLSVEAPQTVGSP